MNYAFESQIRKNCRPAIDENISVLRTQDSTVINIIDSPCFAFSMTHFNMVNNIFIAFFVDFLLIGNLDTGEAMAALYSRHA